MKKLNSGVKESGCMEIGYGEGIRQQEDVDFFDERPDLLESTELI